MHPTPICMRMWTPTPPRQSSKDVPMKYIALIAVIAILLLQLSGAIPQSSVGGPMTLALVFLIAAAGRWDPRGMVEQAGCARLDCEHRRRARRRLRGRRDRRHGFGNDTRAPKSGRVARGDATSPALCVAGRHDAPRAAGVVDRAADRGPDAMSFFGRGRGAATTVRRASIRPQASLTTKNLVSPDWGRAAAFCSVAGWGWAGPRN